MSARPPEKLRKLSNSDRKRLVSGNGYHDVDRRRTNGRKPGASTGALLPVFSADDEPETVEIKIRLDRMQVERLRMIAKEAHLQTGRAISRLLYFALETLLRDKKQREGVHW